MKHRENDPDRAEMMGLKIPGGTQGGDAPVLRLYIRRHLFAVVNGFFRGVGQAFKIELVTVRIDHRGYPHGVADERTPGFDAAGGDFMIDSEGVTALETDGYTAPFFIGRWSFVTGTRRAVLLKHEGRVAKLKPAPAEFSLIDPFPGHHKAETIDVKVQRFFHATYHEERNGLLDVGSCQVERRRRAGRHNCFDSEAAGGTV
jgi:hypothetical protein